MHLDLSSANPVDVIDVRRYRTLSIQSRLVSGATTAVVEAKRAFSNRLDTPSISLAGPVTLTLDGSAITTIDVTDIGYIHLEVTTADAGAVVDIAYKRTGTVFGDVFQRAMNGDYETMQSALVSQDFHKAFMVARPVGAVTTGVFEVYGAVDDGFPAVAYSPSADLVLDGATMLTVDVSSTPLIVPICTTLQTGLRADLYIYARRFVESD